MAVLLSKAYKGYASGSVASFSSSEEAALIAQGLATASTVASTTTGNVTANAMQGTVAIPAGSSSLTVTNNLVDANTSVDVVIRQTAQDSTLTAIPLVVPANGSFTMYANATATATVLASWKLQPLGMTTPA